MSHQSIRLDESFQGPYRTWAEIQNSRRGGSLHKPSVCMVINPKWDARGPNFEFFDHLKFNIFSSFFFCGLRHDHPRSAKLLRYDRGEIRAQKIQVIQNWGKSPYKCPNFILVTGFLACRRSLIDRGPAPRHTSITCVWRRALRKSIFDDNQAENHVIR